MSSLKGARSRARWVALFAFLLLAISAVPVFADDLSTQAPGLPTSEEVIQAIEAEGSGSVQLQTTDSSAAEDLPHQDLNRSEALELLQGVFEVQLQTPAGIYDELQVEKFLSSNVAVIAGDETRALKQRRKNRNRHPR